MADFSLVQEVIRSIRNLRTDKKVTPGKRIPATIVAGDKLDLLAEQLKPISALAHLDANQITLVKDLPEKPQGQAALVVQGIEIYLPLSGLVDNKVESARLQKELDDLTSQISRIETLLGSTFAEKAPAALVDKERQKLASYKESADKLKGQLADLG
jgi:valyl-tRNA synthetase